MAKYLKSFSMDSERLAYEGSENYIEPYISYVDENDSVYYNKPKERRLVATINVTSTSSATNIRYSEAISQFSEIEIDGVVQPSVVASYLFSTTGEHTVKYTLIDETSIGESAFFNCTGLTSIIIPNNITTIGIEAFNGCSGLTSVTISDRVTSIGNMAFNNCSALTNITIPDSVTSIGRDGFAYCSGLTSVTIPENVTSIGDTAFGWCSGLASVTSLSTTPPTSGFYVFMSTNNCPIYVPSESVDAYKAATGWRDYASRIQAIPTT